MKKFFIFVSLIFLLVFSIRPLYAQMGALNQASVSDEQLGERTMEFMMGKETDEQMEKLMGPELSKRMHEMMGQRARLGYGMHGFDRLTTSGFWGKRMFGNNIFMNFFSLLWLVSWILGIGLLVALIRYFWRRGR